ncbi:YutD family protein [Dolosicoccus paucivorans]|uniref:DUF1027 domain-containing protein n=1 Tax=Dolosicoccus paucivorans TaxID=84521 RepID=A0A1G8KHZ5_9LACT|nr:YutD family protein [Dolosicoccus paucivorans]PMB84626.1 DUF1027 domain-containing protein [Dolosicoccus paucivorans]PMC58222.1 DUF1027 domain-containing protein [Dolosicoccus paucivorans]SDI43012.1 Uncharacterized protein YutD [Dolosicoccus paucivorans]
MSQDHSTLSDQIGDILTDIATESSQTSSTTYETYQGTQLDDNLYSIESNDYALVLNYKDAFDLESFLNRYVPYFEGFDYIVGDWGFDQLRLKGFYDLNRKKAPRNQRIDFLDDYLKEYCNFDCKYFVLEKVEKKPLTQVPKSNKSRYNKPKKRSRTPKKKTKPSTRHPFKVKKVSSKKMTPPVERVRKKRNIILH